MPRQQRITFPDAVYHATSPGNGRARIFWDGEDRHRFVRRLEDNVRTYAVMLYAFVLMDNHFHLAATRYIHLNPIKISTCRPLSDPERARRLESYPWSSYPGYMSKRKAQALVYYDVLQEYGSSIATARRHYRAYVPSCITEDDQPFLEACGPANMLSGRTNLSSRRRKDSESCGRARSSTRTLPCPRTRLMLTVSMRTWLGTTGSTLPL